MIEALLLLFAVPGAPLPAPTSPVQASEAQATGLAWLLGRWRGGGTHLGKASHATLEVRPALEGGFLELSYRVSAAGTAPFEGRAFYRDEGDRRWRGHWFDSRGAMFPVVAAAAEREFVADWGTAGTERGRTVYRLLADGRLEVVDSVRRSDGGLSQFARQTFARLP